jgi:hypothetical protein
MIDAARRKYHGRRRAVQSDSDFWDTFTALCRAADAKRAAEPRDERLDFLRELMSSTVSLSEGQAAMYRRHFAGRAAAATVEALMFSLYSRGIAALKEGRLGQLSEVQLREICGRLQRLKPEAWSAAEIDRLLETWDALHGP